MNVFALTAGAAIVFVTEADDGDEAICVSAGIPVLLSTSIKKGLDCEWSDPVQKAEARVIAGLDCAAVAQPNQRTPVG